MQQSQWIEKIGKNFEPKPQYLIPILQFIQSDAGCLTPEAMQAAARFLRISESKVYGVASFYAQFYFEPRGKNTLTICRGTACHVRGSGRLLGEMESVLDVKPGEATEDMSFSLETVACFGACALAPVVVINDQVYRQQTAVSLKKMVGDIRAQTLKGKAKTGLKTRPSRVKKARRKK